jgi:hypothetical protein
MIHPSVRGSYAADGPLFIRHHSASEQQCRGDTAPTAATVTKDLTDCLYWRRFAGPKAVARFHSESVVRNVLMPASAWKRIRTA